MKKIVMLSLSSLLLVSMCQITYAGSDNASQQIQMLNSQIQVQLQKIQSDQQKQIQTLNSQLQAQIKQMHTDFQAQIIKSNTQTQEQLKHVQTTLEQQIKMVQQQGIQKTVVPQTVEQTKH